MSEWKPIDSVPKDGTSVIVYDPDDDIDGRIKVVFWNNGINNWECWADNDSIYRLTHWMPLPEPPK